MQLAMQALPQMPACSDLILGSTLIPRGVFVRDADALATSKGVAVKPARSASFNCQMPGGARVRLQGGWCVWARTVFAHLQGLPEIGGIELDARLQFLLLSGACEACHRLRDARPAPWPITSCRGTSCCTGQVKQAKQAKQAMRCSVGDAAISSFSWLVPGLSWQH